ncbi:MAG: MaoC family dehydratase [Bryobacteraceae bacterium]
MPRVIEGVEELKSLAGSEVGSSDWMTVSQKMINDFAGATGDHQWIHVDPDRARAETPFGGAIAHGFLTLSLLSLLSRGAFEQRGDYAMRINYGLNRLRFVSPVKAGARIRGRFTLQSAEEIAGGVQTVWAVTVEIEGGAKPALVAEWITRAYAQTA